MAAAELATEPLLPAQVSAPMRGQAFGIGIESSVPLAIGLAQSDDAFFGRWTMLDCISPLRLDREWRGAEAMSVIDRRWNGRLWLAVDHHPELGYRIYAPRYGRHLVSSDGTRIVSA